MRQPDSSAQHRAPVLDVWASFRGFAVGFIGGPVREIIQEFATLDEAFAAYHAARAAAVVLAKVRV